MDLVSIVTPVYNSEQYLERCIKSLTNQTYKEVEIILVDDGSKDGSGAICDKCALEDDRIKVLHLKNGGVSNARNNGLEIATGRYVLFMDSDDFYDPNSVENMVESMSGVEMAIARFCFYRNDEIEKIVGPEKNRTISVKEYLDYPFQGEEFGFYCGTNCNKMYDMNIIRKNNLRFSRDITLCEDLLFNLNYIKHVTSVHQISKNIYYYEQGNCTSLIKKERPAGEAWKCKKQVYNQYVKTFKYFDIYNQYEDKISNFFMENVSWEIKEMVERNHNENNVKLELMIQNFCNNNNVNDIAKKSNDESLFVRKMTACIKKGNYRKIVIILKAKCFLKKNMSGLHDFLKKKS